MPHPSHFQTSLVLLSLLLCFLLSLFLSAAPRLFFDFLKATRTIKNSLPLIPMDPTPKKRKTLNSPLPLTPTGLAATRSFFQFFSSNCSQLEARVILALSLQESVSRVSRKCNSFSLLSILNLSDGYMNLYMDVLESRDC